MQRKTMYWINCCYLNCKEIRTETTLLNFAVIYVIITARAIHAVINVNI